MSKKMEPADWQERHSPTEAVTVRITGSRRQETARRRKSDARIFERLLHDDQQQAAVEINDAFNAITGHVGCRIMVYEPDYVPGTGDKGHRMDILRRTYMEWADIGDKGKFSHAAALDIICYGKGLREVDSGRRKAHGFAKTNLVNALDVWCEVRGWKISH